MPTEWQLQITNYGGIIVDVWVPAKDGAFKDVVLGYPKLADYFVPENTFAGAITGRYANRIANGKFTLDGKEYSLAINNGPNTLHGGIVGFSKKVWDARTFTNDAGEQALELIYVSPDGEENFPGTLTTKVVYTVTADNQLRIDYTATTDAPTVLNLTNHAYFNLHGGDHKTSVNSHRVTINADRYTPTDSTLIPTGEIASLDGSALDFRTPTTIGERVLGPDSAFNYRDGYDHNYVIRRSVARRGRDSRGIRAFDRYRNDRADRHSRHSVLYREIARAAGRDGSVLSFCIRFGSPELSGRAESSGFSVGRASPGRNLSPNDRLRFFGEVVVR